MSTITEIQNYRPNILHLEEFVSFLSTVVRMLLMKYVCIKHKKIRTKDSKQHFSIDLQQNVQCSDLSSYSVEYSYSKPLRRSSL